MCPETDPLAGMSVRSPLADPEENRIAVFITISLWNGSHGSDDPRAISRFVQ